MIEINFKQDMSVEPGHQVIVLPDTTEGAALAILLNGQDRPFTRHVPHTDGVDQRIVELIDTLAYMRFSAPGLVQLHMVEASEGQTDKSAEVDG